MSRSLMVFAASAAIALIITSSAICQEGQTGSRGNPSNPASTNRKQGTDEGGAGDQPGEHVPKTPIEESDDLKSKITLGIYTVSGEGVYDLNLRHQFGKVVAWAGVFYDPRGIRAGRFGAEYHYQTKWLQLVPALEVGTNGALAGSATAQIGGDYYALIGIARTNLKPFNDLFFDPSDSMTLGAGHKFNEFERVYAYTVFDNRLHTHQQNTHLLWRKKIGPRDAITFDVLYKSGYTDTGRYIRAAGLGVYYDRPRWFWKAYYDPHVNFTEGNMFRFGLGMKF